MSNFGVGICRNCSEIIQWTEDQQKYHETCNEEYDYLNNIPYAY